MSISVMKKMTVIAKQSDYDALMRRLMRLRCLDLRSTPSDGALLPLTVDVDEMTGIASNVDLLEKTLTRLAVYSERKKTLGRTVHRTDLEDFVLSGKADETQKLLREANDLFTEREGLKRQIEALMQDDLSLTPWTALDVPLEELSTATVQTAFFSMNAKQQKTFDGFDFATYNACAEIVSHGDKIFYFTVTAFKQNLADVTSALMGVGATHVTVKFSTGNVVSVRADLHQKIKDLTTALDGVDEKLRTCATCLDDLEILYDSEKTRLALLENKRLMATVGQCIVLTGWIPEEMIEKAQKVLSSFVCVMEIDEPDDGEEPPILLKNNGFATNFEWVVGMYAYPKYGTFDPTFIMSIFYFIIFGMMFADVGYGILLMIACFGGVKLLNPRPSMRRMLYMFGLCGISCTFMGVLFGGWFGDLPTAIMTNLLHVENAAETPVGRFFSNGLLFNPVTSAMPFLALSLAMGEIHLVTGMIINAVETWKKGHPIEGLCTNLPYIVLFAGVDLMAPSFFVGMIVADPSPELLARFDALSGVGMMVFFISLGMILLLKGACEKSVKGWLIKGLGGLYAIISYASDLLSYSRILALGLVAGVVAQVMNMMTALGSKGVVGFIVMIIVLTGGHLLNIAINLLGTFVHAARLQYIEFFGKFYEDGGEPFVPVSASDVYVEEPTDDGEDNLTFKGFLSAMSPKTILSKIKQQKNQGV